MRANQVKLGAHYAIRHHNEPNLTVIRIESVSIYGGWNARKLKTNRTIRIKSAGKLRFEVVLNPFYAKHGGKKWVKVDAAKTPPANNPPQSRTRTRSKYLTPMWEGLPAELFSVKVATTEKTSTPELTECDGCNGNGKYYGAGYVENGVFKGFVGKCFRCGGKGKQNEADRKRNYGYDNFHRRISA